MRYQLDSTIALYNILVVCEGRGYQVDFAVFDHHLF